MATDPPASTSAEAAAETQATRGPRRHGVAVNTLIFSSATGLSRVAGLFREIQASAYFATSGAFSAFTIAFQVPTLLRQLVADQAVTAAFVPVFTELLEKDRRREAFRLASTLFLIVLAGLGAVTALFILAAPVVMPLFTGDFDGHLRDLTVGMSQLLFPIVVLLGLTGLVVGILNAYDHFTVPALAPLAWNLVIIVLLAVLRGLFEGDDQLYAYAIAVLAGTTVQFLMVLPVLRRYGFRFQLRGADWRDPRVSQVLRLLIPVTIAFGLINFNAVINSAFGARVADYAPRAIDAAFRVYMLPQGMFSVALATVIFPTLARYAARQDLPGLRGAAANGVRQIFLLLIPAAAFTLVLPEPVIRLIYEHGEFGAVDTERVADALFWFSFALPFNGVNLILSRAFFSLQRPWLPAALGVSNIGLNVAVAWALYEPMGVGGIVLGTAAGNLAMLFGQVLVLRRQLRGLEVRETLITVAKILLGSVVLAGVAYAVWRGLDEALGRSLLAQICSVTGAATVGGAAYAAAVSLLRVHEAAQIRNLVMGRLRRG